MEPSEKSSSEDTDLSLVTFVHVTNPYEDTSSLQVSRNDMATTETTAQRGSGHAAVWQASPVFPPPYPSIASSAHGLEALSAAASEDHYLRSLQHVGAPERTQTAAPPPVEYGMNEVSRLSPPIDPQLSNDLSSSVRTSGEAIGLDTSMLEEEMKNDDDVPFLLRYFSESPGAWMDLFDLNSFFAVDVPVKASSCPLLLYAAIALSAKALGRIRISAQYLAQSASKRTPSQWSHKARLYYDLAINLLRQALANSTGHHSAITHVQHDPSESSETLQGATDTTPPWGDARLPDGRNAYPGTDSDELVATTAILCVYEFLDASGLEWSQHLNGAKSLFDITRDGTLPLSSLVRSPGQVVSPSSSSKGRRAVFWNVCRQEMINSCK